MKQLKFYLPSETIGSLMNGNSEPTDFMLKVETNRGIASRTIKIKPQPKTENEKLFCGETELINVVNDLNDATNDLLDNVVYALLSKYSNLNLSENLSEKIKNLPISKKADFIGWFCGLRRPENVDGSDDKCLPTKQVNGLKKTILNKDDGSNSRSLFCRKPQIY